MRKRTWLWESTDITKMDRVKEILRFCVANRVTDIYVQLSTDLLTSYRSFIAEASLVGISVHAAMGDRSWYAISSFQQIKSKLDWLALYQSIVGAHEMFRGVHFDIEPHTYPAWQIPSAPPEEYPETRETMVEEWVNVVGLYRAIVKDQMGLELSAGLPFSLSKIQYSEGILSEFMISNHDHIVVMAYRDKADGNDSILYHSQLFIAQADTLRRPESVVVAVETKDVDPAKLTFAQEGRNYMDRELATVDYELRSYKSYGGLAIHSLKYWMTLQP